MFSQLFRYKLVFITELLIITALFTFKLKKRHYFALRSVFAALALYACTYLVPVLYYNAWYTSLLFVLLFGFMLAAIKFCYNESWVNVFFCGIVAYTVRHLAYLIYNLLAAALGLSKLGATAAYLNVPELSEFSLTACLTGITYGISYYIVYWLMYLVFGRRIRYKQDLRIDNVSLIFLSFSILLVDIVLNAVAVYYSADNFDFLYMTLNYLYGIISCCLVLFIQFTLIGKKQLKQELDTIQTLWRRQQKQYKMSKDNIELINIKCHDLKHQLSAFRGRIEENELNEIEKAVLLYDAYVKTGNDTLDVILTEKSLFCEKNKIQLSCVVDKSSLDFISIADLYALFGNALDNAIEAVLKIKDTAKRVICLNIKNVNNFLFIHIDNFYSDEIKIADGLPATLKNDWRYHGFGMKSIKLITEKYDGNMTVRADGEQFKLDILIPLKKTT